MVKCIIQIPCLNEEKTLPVTLREIPRKIKGIDVVEILVIDDGSTDRTSEVARQCGVDHVFCFKERRGLARAFMAGLEESLRLGADIIVNTDADNQYQGQDIPLLIEPILNGHADIVVGDRNTDGIGHFSWTKRKLQRIGSWVVRKLSETDVNDAPSGFRAWSREAALRINVISEYTYTLETIIQAGQKQLTVRSVRVRTNHKLRESKLMKGVPHYLRKSAVTMIRIFTLYQPLKVFSWVGATIFGMGVLIGLRYLYLQFSGSDAEHFASLIFCAVCLIMGFNFLMLGLLGDLIGSNRHLIESILYRIRKSELPVSSPTERTPGKQRKPEWEVSELPVSSPTERTPGKQRKPEWEVSARCD